MSLGRTSLEVSSLESGHDSRSTTTPNFNPTDFQSGARSADVSDSSSFSGFQLPKFEVFETSDKSKQPEKVDLEKFENKAFDAYMDALGKTSENGYGEKFTVLMFTRDNCGFCARNKEQLAKEGAKYADKAVFSVSDPTKDQGGKQLFDAIEGKAYPITVVLATSDRTIRVAGQAVGELDADQMNKFLSDSMKKPMVAYRNEDSVKTSDAMV
ncbi:MAG: hypothetical protein R3C24_01415 [Cyanobacteriota/Melainabacteria group bacterium]|nr:hypothetical protein [Cyanobacteria bacterium HKST-UBA01]MCB9470764.1 hypothetical protein [Candidatus Obscuribacterales bacterium]